jgi:hypothetical protein
MSKAATKAKASTLKRPNAAALISLWVVSLASILLLLPTGSVMSADAGSFRSCSANSTDLFIENCGKRGINGGDILVLFLFFGSLAVVVSLFTHAWRLTRRHS